MVLISSCSNCERPRWAFYTTTIFCPGVGPWRTALARHIGGSLLGGFGRFLMVAIRLQYERKLQTWQVSHVQGPSEDEGLSLAGPRLMNR